MRCRLSIIATLSGSFLLDMDLSPVELDEAAAALEASDKMDEYLALTEALVRESPARADVHLHRARALAFGANRREEALEQVQLAADLVTEDAPELMRLAAVLHSLGEPERVDEYVQRAVACAGLSDASEETSLAYLAGMSAAARGDDDRAVELLEAAVGRRPRDAWYAIDLARLYIRRGDRQRAEGLAAAALRYFPADERLRRIADPADAATHIDAWNAAVVQVLEGTTSSLRCPAHDDGDLVWEPVPAIDASVERHRLYCPHCGAEVRVDVDSAGARR